MVSAWPSRGGVRHGIGFSVFSVASFRRASQLRCGRRTKSAKSILHVNEPEQTGARLPAGATNKIPPKRVDPGRTRACNLWFRRPTPYPLGHRTTRKKLDFVYMLRDSKMKAEPCWLNTGSDCDSLKFRQVDWTGRCQHCPVGLGRTMELDFRSSLCLATGEQAS